jgi:hypothetical protein
MFKRLRDFVLIMKAAVPATLSACCIFGNPPINHKSNFPNAPQKGQGVER